MNNLQHPSQLNPLLVYQQSKRIAQKTSRATNQDWYLEPYQIQRQWHIWLDGEEVISTLFDSKANRWIEGPTMSWFEREMEGAEDGEAVDAFQVSVEQHGLEPSDREEMNSALAEVLRSRELGGKVSSLGVIVHFADEFAVLDPSREYSSNKDFDEVQALLQVNPKDVLGDSTVDPLLSTWRIMPCWGVKEGRTNVAVQLDRKREVFFNAVRDYGEDNNIAIKAVGASSPLETLSLAPLYLDWDSGQKRGDIIVLMYRRFSALMVLNKSGELMQLRSLTHRAGSEYPVGLGDILMNTQTSVGLENPVVTIIPMSGGPGKEQLTSELTSFFARRAPMDIGFSELDQMEVLEKIPHQRIEMILGDQTDMEALMEGKELMETATFAALHEGWGTQDFYPIPDEEAEKYPSWQEMQLRKWFGIAKAVLLVIVFGVAGWGGLKVMKTINTEAWQTPDVEPGAAPQGIIKLRKEKGTLDYWEKVMQERSEGWIVMQMILDLFPEGAGIVITDLDYRITSMVAQRSGSKGKELGYVREWRLTGFSTPRGRNVLSKLGSTGFMNDWFNQFAAKYKAEEYSLTGTRTINVTLEEDVKQYPASGVMSREEAAAYTTSFTLAIKQNILPEDELSLPIKLPK